MGAAHASARVTRTRRLVVALAAVLLGAGASAACAPSTPQAILYVPGNYVADLWNPPVGFSHGGAGATVLMCLDSTSAVHIETGDGGDGWVGSIRLEWAGTAFEAPSTGSATTLTTPVLQPGCGLLHFSVDCCHVDHFLAIKATKV
jgi:hypothetical protein